MYCCRFFSVVFSATSTCINIGCCRSEYMPERKQQRRIGEFVSSYGF